jgi:hypothetical protein
MFWASWCAAMPLHARAYSSFGDYTRSIQEGGGGGRLFSGTPADAYGCDVCHRGATGANLEVVGLPEPGYVPGQTYEISLVWPPETPHVAVMAELTDEAGMPSGVTSLAPYATWQEGERCAGSGFPAADVCRAGGAGDGCCRDLDPTRDACSFPNERSVLWVGDCESRFARVVWTAPAVPAGDVWFCAEMVTSNLQNDAVGDGVTSVRRRIRPAGAVPEAPLVVDNGCTAAAGARIVSPNLGTAWLLPVIALLMRRRRRAHGTDHDRTSLPMTGDLDCEQPPRRSRR